MSIPLTDPEAHSQWLSTATYNSQPRPSHGQAADHSLQSLRVCPESAEWVKVPTLSLDVLVTVYYQRKLVCRSAYDVRSDETLVHLPIVTEPE